MIPTNPNEKSILFPHHHLGDSIKAGNYKSGTMMVDWQELILPKGASPGNYTIALRLLNTAPCKATKETSLQSNWFPVTDVTLISNKRNVLKQLLNGNLHNFRLGLKVLQSIL